MALQRVTVGGVSLLVRPETWDANIAREVIDGDVYRARNWVPQNPVTVFDVGGHIGSFTRWLATRLPKMRGFVFEMDESNQQVIEQNVADLHNVRLVRAALGGRSGEVWRGPVQTVNTGGGGIFWDASSGAAKVTAISIIDFMRDSGVEYIDLLKLDCEGSEFSILDALAAEPSGLQRRVGCVRAEVHATRDEARFIRLMDQLRASFPFVDVAPTGSAALSMVYAWR